ncbi:hypothetical protein K445DRAFT_12303 [Daldinia sp. EC12]|nr:hypothetical protein K445DRAFT_12303 [Daldinia sp. EC12]
MKTQTGLVLDMIKINVAKSNDVQRQLEEIKSKMSSANKDLHEQFQRVLEEIFKEIKEYPRGEQSNRRYYEAHDNLVDTFEWIFREPQRFFEAEPDLRVSFTDWLRDGDGIFHILGKPGAGKSTLMKFIWKHETTKDMLNKWAGTSQLLCLKYFFWPTSHQDGLMGLRCPFLMSALQQAPGLMELIVPGHGNLNLKVRTPLGYEEISQATHLLISSPSVLDRYRIFLLIDGLDEFDEKKHAEDHHNLVHLIQNWTFLSGVSKFVLLVRRMRLSCRQDMQAYITERWETHLDFPELRKEFAQLQKGLCNGPKSHRRTTECLVAHIINIAEGICLWTRLAMLELRNFLSGDHDLTE